MDTTTMRRRLMGKVRAKSGRAPGYVGLALVGLLLVALAGCATSTTGTAQATESGAGSARATVSATSSATTTTTTATPNQLSGPGAQLGIADVCTQPVSVSAQLPSSIPAYPGAQLRVSQTSGGNGIFGYCTTDDNNAIALFYSTQLGEKGWQNMKASAIENVNQIFASQGTASVIITIEPDPQVRGSTAIIIQTTGL